MYEAYEPHERSTSSETGWIADRAILVAGLRYRSSCSPDHKSETPH
jgi:hypothetical protein